MPCPIDAKAEAAAGTPRLSDFEGRLRLPVDEHESEARANLAIAVRV